MKSINRIKGIVLLIVLGEAISLLIFKHRYDDFGVLLEQINQSHYNSPSIDELKFNSILQKSNIPSSKVLEKINFLGDSYHDDVEELFIVLECFYGLYGYYGGNEIFDDAKNNIISQISMAEELDSTKFKNILTHNLNFITDNHFLIDGQAINTEGKYYYYYNDESYFLDSKGYFKNINGNKIYIRKINNSIDVSNYMKQSINKKGELTYNIGLVENEVPQDIVVQYDIGSQEIPLKRTVPMSVSRIYEEYFIEEIPVIAIPSMPSQYDNTKEVASQFLESAKKFKNEDVLIIDIRGNKGGDLLTPAKWILEYTGEKPRSDAYSALAYTSSLHSEVEESIFEVDNKELQELLYILSAKEINKYWIQLGEKGRGEPIKNDNIIFILVDGNTASSAERFVDYMRNIENTVIVGTNTNGTAIGVEGIRIKLGFSGLEINIGTHMNIFNEEVFKESRGFTPDIFIESQYALEYVVELIHRYIKK